MAGGVSNGAVANINYLPPVSLAIGLVAGIISTLCFRYLTPFLEKKAKVYDTYGTHNLHGIPGILGGIFSGIIIGCYEIGYDQLYVDGFYKVNLWTLPNADSFILQGAYQIAGTFCSLGIAIVGGVLCGFLLILFYDEENGSFYRDDRYI